MNCELCGKKIGKPKKVRVEGSTLQVCEQCARHGEEVLEHKNKDVKELLSRVNKSKSKNIRRKGFGEEGKTLVMDYPDKIREARLKQDLTQEELAKKLNEKKSVVAKLEKEDMRPSEDLRKKLERTLNVSLLEEIEQFSQTSEHKDAGLTIGDLIKEE